MAESEFREYQDADGDGKHDVCAEVEARNLPEEECPSCEPNAAAIVPDWTIETTPFLNERTCEYWVPLMTSYTGTGGDELESRLEEFVEIAINMLLAHYGKQQTTTTTNEETGETPTGTVDALIQVSTVIDYHLGGHSVLPREGLGMKICVAVPAFNFDQIPEATSAGATDVLDSSESPTIPSEVTLEYKEVKHMIRRLNSVLRLYTAYHKLFWHTEDSRLVYEGGKAWNGITIIDELNNAQEQLYNFLRSKGYYFKGIAGFGKKVVDKVTLGFSTNPETSHPVLSYVSIVQPGCDEDPEIFNFMAPMFTGMIIDHNSPFRNPTVCGYFANLNAISDDLTAREPLPWKEFVIKHTYPAVSIKTGPEYSDHDDCSANDLNTLTEPITDFLSDLGDFFTLSDIISMRFTSDACVDKKEINKLDIVAKDGKKGEKTKTKIWEEEKLKEFAPELSACDHVPAIFKTIFTNDDEPVATLWKDMLDPLGKCGMLSVMTEGIACLMSGITLEASLARIMESALKSMSVKHMQTMFDGMSLERKEQLNAELVSIWGSDEKPWFDEYASAEALDKGANPIKSRQTLGTPAASTFEELKHAYIGAIFNVHTDVDSLYELLTHMNKFPGQQIVTRILAAVPCATSPIIWPPAGDWLKDIDFAFCRDNDKITAPDFELMNPFRNFPKAFDLMSIVMDKAEAEVELKIAEAIIKLIAKIIQIICDGMCKVLANPAAAVTSLGMENGGQKFAMLMRQAFCGAEATEEEVVETIDNLFNSMSGATSAQTEAMASGESSTDLMETVSSVITQDELVDLVNGNADEQLKQICYQAVAIENPEFLPIFPTPNTLADFFKNIGDLISPDLKKELADRLDERNRELADYQFGNAAPCLSVCPSEAEIDAFDALRCSLIANSDGTTEDQCAEQFDKIRSRALDDLGTLADIAQDGVEGYLDDVLPEIVGDSCDAILQTNSEDTLSMVSEMTAAGQDAMKDLLTDGLIGRKGMLNYILSDTNGVPYTRHQFRSSILPFYVNEVDEGPSALSAIERGYYPETVAVWLQDSLKNLEIEYEYIPAGIEMPSAPGVEERGSPAISRTTLSFRDNDYGRDQDRDFLTGFDIQLTDTPSGDVGVVVTDVENFNEERSFQDISATISKGVTAGPAVTITDESLPFSRGLLSSMIENIWTENGYDLNFSEAIEGFTDGSSISDALMIDYDNINSKFINNLSSVIAGNDAAFMFGYEAEEIEESDLEYLNPDGTPYSYDNEDAILGISGHQDRVGEDANRVHYMDPAKYGGRYTNPPLYISPAKKAGWLGIAQTLAPEIDACGPKNPSDLINFEDIKQILDDRFRNTTEDPRLTANPECVVEAPYARILDKSSVANIEANVITTIRLYILQEMLKGMPVFTKFKLRSPEVFNNIYMGYIVDRMEIEMKESGRSLGALKNESYWYSFLEQCVQVVDRKVKNEELSSFAAAAAESRLQELNTVQTDYDFPSRDDLKNAVSDEEKVLGQTINSSYLLMRHGIKRYRTLKALEAVRDSEDIAKSIISYLVAEQIEFVADNLSDVLATADLNPKIDNIYKFFVGSSGMCLGSSLQLDLSDAATEGSVIDVASDINESDNIERFGDSLISQISTAFLGLAGMGDMAEAGMTLAGMKSTLLQSFPQAASLLDALLGKGAFVLEKYIYVEDPKDDIGIADDDYTLKGVVNIETFKTFLENLDDDTKSGLISDYFGNLTIVEGGQIPVLEGETTENAGHVHEYYLDENGNGIADYAYPADQPHLRHQHKIQGYAVSEAYSPAAKQTHAHMIQYEEAGESPASLAGSIGLRYGLRVCYIPSFEFAMSIYAQSGEGYTDDFIVNSQIQKAFNFQGDPSAIVDTLSGIVSTANLVPGVDIALTLDPFKYMFPIASAEIDVLDETLGALANNISSGYNMECLVDMLVNNGEFQSMFNSATSLPLAMSILAIYTTKAFLPSIGQDTADDSGTPGADGEWASYSDRKFLGFQSPYDRWDQESFLRLKKVLRNTFLSNYNVNDPEYSDPMEPRDSLSGRLKDRFTATSVDIPIPWFKRKKLISRPFNKDDEECE